MKLTGEMVYNAALALTKFGESAPWEEARNQQHYHDLAALLNAAIAQHQTQPLAGQEPRYITASVTFFADNATFAGVCEDIDRDVNAWLDDLNIDIVSSHIDMVVVDGRFYRSMQFLVKYLVEPDEAEE